MPDKIVRDQRGISTLYKDNGDGSVTPYVNIGSVPALVADVGTKTADAQGIGATASMRLVGWSATENAGSPAAASFTLRHGTSVAGTRLCAAIKLAAGESASDEFPGDGIATAGGVFIDWLSGSFDLVLYYKVVA